MFYHRFCQLFGFTASLTCDKIEQILLNSLSTFYRLVWRSRQLEDKTLSSEKCFLTFYRRSNLQSAIGTGNVRPLQHGGCLQTSVSLCKLFLSWKQGEFQSWNRPDISKCRHHDIIPADTTQPKLFQIHKVLSHHLFPSPILFISSSPFLSFIYLLCIFIFSPSSRFSLYTMSSCIPFVLFTLFSLILSSPSVYLK